MSTTQTSGMNGKIKYTMLVWNFGGCDMIGDIILWLKREILQMFCEHDYKQDKIGLELGHDIQECKKCNRRVNGKARLKHCNTGHK